MNNLKELQDLGVQELQVSNGQAVAVNPYDEIDSFGPEWNKFEDLNLPPLPCSESVKEGRYSIDRFEEQWQFQNAVSKEWLISSAMGEFDTFDEYSEFLSGSDIPTRTVLILSEPVAESEPKLSDKIGHINCDPEALKDPEFVKAVNHMADLAYNMPKKVLVLSEPVAENEKCSAGCIHYTGGEIRHTKGCVFYPDSLTEGESEKSMVDYILEIDWMGTKEFCDKYGIPVPYYTGDVKSSADQFTRIAAIKQNMFVEYAKKLKRSKPSPPEAEPVASAEETAKEFLWHWLRRQNLEDTGHSLELPFVWEAMEEYASLRVAQEKNSLIEKLEVLLNREDAGKAIYSADGIQEAIDLIKNS